MEYLPEKLIEMMPHLPTKKYKYIRQTRETITAIAAEVMAGKLSNMRKGLEDGRDLLSLLLRANAGEDPQRRMSDEEINAGVTSVQYQS